MAAGDRIGKLHAAALFFGMCFSLPLTFVPLGWEDRDWVVYLFGFALLFVVSYIALGDAAPGAIGRFLVPCFALAWTGLVVIAVAFSLFALEGSGSPGLAAVAALAAVALEYGALRSARWRLVSSIAIIAGALFFWLWAAPLTFTEFRREIGDAYHPGRIVWSNAVTLPVPAWSLVPAAIVIAGRMRPASRLRKVIFLLLAIGVPLICSAYCGLTVRAISQARQQHSGSRWFASFEDGHPWAATIPVLLLLASCAASARFAWSLTSPIPAAVRAVAIVALMAVEGGARVTFPPILAFTAVLAPARLVPTDALTRRRRVIVIAGWIAGSLAMAAFLIAAKRPSSSASTWPILASGC